jgi:hypothetical protein
MPCCNRPRAHPSKQVHLILLDFLIARVTLIEEGRANTSNFVIGKTGLNATSINDYATLSISLCDLPG